MSNFCFCRRHFLPGKKLTLFSLLQAPVKVMSRFLQTSRNLLSSRIEDLRAEVNELEEEVAKDRPADGAKGDAELEEMLEREKAKLAAEEDAETERKKSEILIPETEKITGQEQKLEFQAETRKLLDIVARSIYSEREVFVRELISNASDALEKLRYRQMTGQLTPETTPDPHLPLEIRISVDEDKKTLTIQDTGCGMRKEELISDLGRIGHSGTGEFVKVVESGADKGNLIGQFGVGFYSVFMVAKRVKVYSKSIKDPVDAPGTVWISDGAGTYSVADAEGVQRGTKIILELDDKSFEFCNRQTIETIVKKYSNFVGFDIAVNGGKVNTVKALWMMPKDKITPEEHKEFYQFIAHAYDEPMFNLHYSTDSPISVRALFYVPEQHMEKYGLGVMEPGVNLFSRKVMIQSKCKGLLPDWLRFIKGVVDSEEVPLNISRETLQDSQILKRIGAVLTRRVLKFLEEESKRDKEKYEKFFREYAQFLKQGVCTDLKWKEDIAKLLRVESSKTVGTEMASFEEYVDRMAANQKSIFYLCAPSRQLAEASPYYEAFKSKGVEVLFLYSSIDDFVMTNLAEFKGKKCMSVESSQAAEELKDVESRADSEKSDDEKKADDNETAALNDESFKNVCNWLKDTLAARVTTVSESSRLSSSPAIVIDHESASFRRMMRFVDPGRAPVVPKVHLQINRKHPIIVGLETLRTADAALADEVAQQIMDNALIQAGLLDDSRGMIPRLNKLIEKAISGATKA
jgi:TNF receptor-associated protein 1